MFERECVSGAQGKGPPQSVGSTTTSDAPNARTTNTGFAAKSPLGALRMVFVPSYDEKDEPMFDDHRRQSSIRVWWTFFLEEATYKQDKTRREF